MDTCDPDADIANLRKLIKMNTGHSIKLTREQICQVYDDIQAGKLPLPPLVLDSKMSYLTDKKSPLTPKDFDVLFDSSSKTSINTFPIAFLFNSGSETPANSE